MNRKEKQCCVTNGIPIWESRLFVQHLMNYQALVNGIRNRLAANHYPL